MNFEYSTTTHRILSVILYLVSCQINWRYVCYFVYLFVVSQKNYVFPIGFIVLELVKHDFCDIVLEVIFIT